MVESVCVCPLCTHACVCVYLLCPCTYAYVCTHVYVHVFQRSSSRGQEEEVLALQSAPTLPLPLFMTSLSFGMDICTVATPACTTVTPRNGHCKGKNLISESQRDDQRQGSGEGSGEESKEPSKTGKQGVSNNSEKPWHWPHQRSSAGLGR